MTDDSYQMANTTNLTPRTFLNSFLPYNANVSVEEKFKVFLREDRIDTYDRFEWLGLFQDEPIIGVEKCKSSSGASENTCE